LGTRCAEGQCIAGRADEETRPGNAGRRKARRLARRPRRGGGLGAVDEPPLKKASAAELRPVSRGASLRDPEVIDMDAAEGAELSSAEIERRFRTLDRPIAGCIERAREGYDAQGRVIVALRIERSGAVAKWRLTAPALLVQRGLHGCIDPLLRGLRFPQSARAAVMTYPYHFD
jgi:hypothetical protein